MGSFKTKEILSIKVTFIFHFPHLCYNFLSLFTFLVICIVYFQPISLGSLYDLKSHNIIYGFLDAQNEERSIKRYAEFIELSIEAYKKVLEIDSLDYSANYNLGVIYHNLGVDLILNEVDYIEDIELL